MREVTKSSTTSRDARPTLRCNKTARRDTPRDRVFRQRTASTSSTFPDVSNPFPESFQPFPNIDRASHEHRRRRRRHQQRRHRRHVRRVPHQTARTRALRHDGTELAPVRPSPTPPRAPWASPGGTTPRSRACRRRRRRADDPPARRPTSRTSRAAVSASPRRGKHRGQPRVERPRKRLLHRGPTPAGLRGGRGQRPRARATDEPPAAREQKTSDAQLGLKKRWTPAFNPTIEALRPKNPASRRRIEKSRCSTRTAAQLRMHRRDSVYTIDLAARLADGPRCGPCWTLAQPRRRQPRRRIVDGARLAEPALRPPPRPRSPTRLEPRRSRARGMDAASATTRRQGRAAGRRAVGARRGGGRQSRSSRPRPQRQTTTGQVGGRTAPARRRLSCCRRRAACRRTEGRGRTR